MALLIFVAALFSGACGMRAACAGSWSAPVYVNSPYTDYAGEGKTQNIAANTTLEVNGSAHVKFYWTPDAGKTLAEDQPPRSVLMSVASNASWFAGPQSQSQPPTEVRLPSDARGGRSRLIKQDFNAGHFTPVRFGVSQNAPQVRVLLIGSGGSGTTYSGSASNGFTPYSGKAIAGSSNGTKLMSAPVNREQGLVDFTAPQCSASVIATGPATASVNWSTTVAITNRQLRISSNIDQSYYKSTVAPTPIPVAAGMPQPTPVPPLDGPTPSWMLPVPPGEPVHSVATWNQGLLAWIGGGQFQSNESGFQAPWNRVWKVSGGTPTTQDAVNQMAQGYNPLPSLYLNLGGTNSGGGMTRQSTLTVTLDDSSGLGSASYDYVINWHRSVDNFQQVPGNPPHDGTPSYRYPVPIKIENDTTVNELSPGQSGQFTNDLAQVQVKSGAESWQLVCNIGSSVVSSVPVVGTVASGALAWAGYSLGEVSDPLPEPISNDWGKWMESVNTQTGFNVNGHHTGPPEEQRLFPENMAEASHPNASTDPNYKDCSMSLCIRTTPRVLPYLADTYGVNGFTGVTSGEITRPLRLNIYKFYSIYNYRG